MSNTSATKQKECKQCGTCCHKGGPALHQEDMALLREGIIALTDLVTIRKGEPVYSPATDHLEPAVFELLKIKGGKGRWTCCFYNQAASNCKIYADRPLECRLLKCWDPAELLNIVNTAIIARKDVLQDDDPRCAVIKAHEEQCAVDRISELMRPLFENRRADTDLAGLAELVRKDLIIRDTALQRRLITPQEEFFVLGRPLFKILEGFGIIAKDSNNTIELRWRP